jgi:hypothetical protein
VVELYKFINLPKCTDLYSYTMIIEWLEIILMKLLKNWKDLSSSAT